MYLKFFLFLCMIGIIASCKSDTTKKSTSSTTQTTTSTRTDGLPAPPAEFMNTLRTQTQGIDYMFRNTNFSISQDDAGSIATTMKTMGTEKSVFMDKTCQSPVRMTFIGEQGIIADVEMYMDQACMYQVYLVNNKPTYSAKITQSAYAYLNNLINQAKNVQR